MNLLFVVEANRFLGSYKCRIELDSYLRVSADFAVSFT